MKNPVIKISSQKYYGQRDEEMFFTWLDSIACVESYKSEGKDIYVTLSSTVIPLEDYLALRGLLQRYGQSRKQLHQLQVSEQSKEEHGDGADYITLHCASTQFYSPLDSDMFFEWRNQISAIKDFQVLHGTSDTLYFYIGSDISNKDFLEIVGLFKRYNLDLQQLETFVNDSNAWWFYPLASDEFDKR